MYFPPGFFTGATQILANTRKSTQEFINKINKFHLIKPYNNDVLQNHLIFSKYIFIPVCVYFLIRGNI